MKISEMIIEAIVVIWIVGGVLGLAFGADLAPPRHRFVPHVPEPCVDSNAKPVPGQTIRQDKTCPSGMRWINPHG